MRCHLALCTILAASLAVPTHVRAQQAGASGIGHTVGTIRARMLQQLGHEQVGGATQADIVALIEPDEMRMLSSGHLGFEVDAPATVYVMQSPDSGTAPFWLESQGFERTGLTAQVDQEDVYTAWRKSVPAGEVGLGVPSIEGGIKPYFVLIGPAQAGGRQPQVDALRPTTLATSTAEPGKRIFADDTDTLDRLDADLRNLTLLQTLEGAEDSGRLMGYFRNTAHPSSDTPDHVVLTWSGDPSTTQSIQWRTGPDSDNGVLAYSLADAGGEPRVVRADSQQIEADYVANDPLVLRHTVALQGLQAGTAYQYAIGDGETWGEWRTFETEPAADTAFSFVYMGDAQNGLDTWGELVRTAHRKHPDAAFYVMAGDLVDKGEHRDDWDKLLHNAGTVYDGHPLVPAIGNHEVHQNHADLYLALFGLPENGPAGIEPGRAYAMEYSNAQFVVLDSNLPPEDQTRWLDKTLGASDAEWKFVVYHHPLYSTKPNDRGQPELKAEWAPIFEKHGVDLALQGDDHAYLRTYPMKGDQVMDSPADGPIYILSVAGTKKYEQEKAAFVEKQFTDISTYQVIEIDGDRLNYRAYDVDGTVHDEFVLQK